MIFSFQIRINKYDLPIPNLPYPMLAMMIPYQLV